MLRWFRARKSAPVLPEVGTTPVPRWVTELTELVQKQSRASFKQAAQLEAALAEQASSLASVHSVLERQTSQLAHARERASMSKATEYAALFDALDGLDEAIRLCSDTHLSAGLALVAERVLRVCESAGFRRVDVAGRPPEPRLCKVVGMEHAHGAVPSGSVCRVVQAPIVQADGDRLVREGAVIVARDAAGQAEREQENERVGN